MVAVAKRKSAKQIAAQRIWQAAGAASRRSLGHTIPSKSAAQFGVGPNGQKMAPSLDAVGAVWQKPIKLKRKGFSKAISAEDLTGRVV